MLDFQPPEINKTVYDDSTLIDNKNDIFAYYELFKIIKTREKYQKGKNVCYENYTK